MNTPFTHSDTISLSPLRKVLEKEMSKSKNVPSSPLGRMLYYWKGNPGMRIAIGAGLLGGGLIATATGAFATAGIILGARAGISALGAFTSSRGLYELIRGKYSKSHMEHIIERAKRATNPEALNNLMVEIESNHSKKQIDDLCLEHEKSVKKQAIIGNIIGITAASVAGILALSGSPSLRDSGVITTNVVSVIPEKVPTNIFDVSKIAEDIRHDHPKQGWITLEQMIRRVEGLRMGIGLDQSEKLVSLNESVSQMIHQPQGIVAETLKMKGYHESIGVESICRHLSEHEIKAITEAYIEQTNPVLDIPPQVATVLTNPTISPLHHSYFELGLKGLGSSMILGAGSYFGYRFIKGDKMTSAIDSPSEQKDSTRSNFSEATQNINLWEDQKVKKHNEATLTPVEIGVPPLLDSKNTELGGNSKSVIITEMNQNDIHVSEIEENGKKDQISESTQELLPKTGETRDTSNAIASKIGTSEAVSCLILSESALRIQGKIQAYFRDEYDWEIEPETENSTPEKHIETYHGSTFAGQYQVYVTYFDAGVQTTIVWYDHDAIRSHVQSEIMSYSSLLDPLNPELTLESRLDNVYLDMLIQRDKIKTDDLKYIDTVRIPESHLETIYQHMEQPGVRINNLEILGLWLASAYDIQDHILPLDILANPRIEDQIITSASCKLKNHDVAWKHHMENPNRVISQLFPKKEAEIITDKRIGEYRPGGGRNIIFSSAMQNMNWHKHPDYLVHPSQGDVNEAKKDLDIQFPGVETYSYTIAVRITDTEVSRLSGNSQVVVLPRSTYKGEYNYALRSYQLIFEQRELQEMRQLHIQLK